MLLLLLSPDHLLWISYSKAFYCYRRQRSHELLQLSLCHYFLLNEFLSQTLVTSIIGLPYFEKSSAALYQWTYDAFECILQSFEPP